MSVWWMAAVGVLAANGWGSSVSAMRDEIGHRARFECAPLPSEDGGQDPDIGMVWGTGPYSADSDVCAAAVHAGLITTREGGVVLVRIVKTRDSFRGGYANGVLARSHAKWGGTFVFESVDPLPPRSPEDVEDPERDPDEETSESFGLPPAGSSPDAGSVTDPELFHIEEWARGTSEIPEFEFACPVPNHATAGDHSACGLDPFRGMVDPSLAAALSRALDEVHAGPITGGGEKLRLIFADAWGAVVVVDVTLEESGGGHLTGVLEERAWKNSARSERAIRAADAAKIRELVAAAKASSERVTKRPSCHECDLVFLEHSNDGRYEAGLVSEPLVDLLLDRSRLPEITPGRPGSY